MPHLNILEYYTEQYIMGNKADDIYGNFNITGDLDKALKYCHTYRFLKKSCQSLQTTILHRES